MRPHAAVKGSNGARCILRHYSATGAARSVDVHKCKRVEGNVEETGRIFF
jgi:hypothetical protein